MGALFEDNGTTFFKALVKKDPGSHPQRIYFINELKIEHGIFVTLAMQAAQDFRNRFINSTL